MAMNTLAETFYCRAVLDRLVLGSDAVFQKLPKRIPGFTRLKDYAIDRFKNEKPADLRYRRRSEWKNNRTGSKLIINYQRLPGVFADRIRLQLSASNDFDISVREINTLRETFHPCLLRILEIAFDFIPDAEIDGEYVETHGKFGKSRRLLKPGFEKLHYWGDRKSSKSVRAYDKAELERYRVEIELHNRLIRHFRLSDFSTFCELSDLLIPNHIRFVRIDWKKVRQFCSDQNISTGFIDLARARKSLQGRLEILRQKTQILNIHRYLRPLNKNKYLRSALADFVSRYGKLARSPFRSPDLRKTKLSKLRNESI